MSAGQVRSKPATSIGAAARAVCDSRGDRIGSYRRVFDRFLAVDRLDTESAAVDSISAAAGAA